MPSLAQDRRSRLPISLCIATFLAVHLVNPILQARREESAWKRSDYHQQSSRLPYLPRQSWSPRVNDREESSVRKNEAPRFKAPPVSVLKLAAFPSSAERLRPGHYPPVLDSLTRPDYLQLERTPFSWLSPPA
jgi:hypothetical protein